MVPSSLLISPHLFAWPRSTKQVSFYGSVCSSCRCFPHLTPMIDAAVAELYPVATKVDSVEVNLCRRNSIRHRRRSIRDRQNSIRWRRMLIQDMQTLIWQWLNLNPGQWGRFRDGSSCSREQANLLYHQICCSGSSLRTITSKSCWHRRANLAHPHEQGNPCQMEQCCRAKWSFHYTTKHVSLLS